MASSILAATHPGAAHKDKKVWDGLPTLMEGHVWLHDDASTPGVWKPHWACLCTAGLRVLAAGASGGEPGVDPPAVVFAEREGYRFVEGKHFRPAVRTDGEEGVGDGVLHVMLLDVEGGEVRMGLGAEWEVESWMAAANMVFYLSRGEEENGGGNGPTPVLQGYLTKRGQNRKNWTKRWVWLSLEELKYATGVGKKARGRIDLALVLSVDLCRNDKISTNPLCFRVVTADRVYYFVPDDERTMAKWVAAIEAALRALGSLPEGYVSALADGNDPIPVPIAEYPAGHKRKDGRKTSGRRGGRKVSGSQQRRRRSSSRRLASVSLLGSHSSFGELPVLADEGASTGDGDGGSSGGGGGVQAEAEAEAENGEEVEDALVCGDLGVVAWTSSSMSSLGSDGNVYAVLSHSQLILYKAQGGDAKHIIPVAGIVCVRKGQDEGGHSSSSSTLSGRKISSTRRRSHRKTMVQPSVLDALASAGTVEEEEMMEEGDEEEKRDGDRMFPFALETVSERLTLGAFSRNERAAWVEALSSIKQVPEFPLGPVECWKVWRMAFEAGSDPHSRVTDAVRARNTVAAYTASGVALTHTFAELASICIPPLADLVLEPRSRVELTPVERTKKRPEERVLLSVEHGDEQLEGKGRVVLVKRELGGWRVEQESWGSIPEQLRTRGTPPPPPTTPTT